MGNLPIVGRIVQESNNEKCLKEGWIDVWEGSGTHYSREGYFLQKPGQSLDDALLIMNPGAIPIPGEEFWKTIKEAIKDLQRIQLYPGPEVIIIDLAEGIRTRYCPIVNKDGMGGVDELVTHLNLSAVEGEMSRGERAK